MDDTDYAFGRSRAEYDRLIEQGELLSASDGTDVARGWDYARHASARCRLWRR